MKSSLHQPSESHISRMRRIYEDQQLSSDGDGVPPPHPGPRQSYRSPDKPKSALLRRRSPPLSTQKIKETLRIPEEKSTVEADEQRGGIDTTRVSFSPPTLSKLTPNQESQCPPLGSDMIKKGEEVEKLDQVIETESGFEFSSTHDDGFYSDTENIDPTQLDLPTPTLRSDCIEQNMFGEEYCPPTKLHEICHTAETGDDLLGFLHMPSIRGRSLKSMASHKDNEGRLPLHILSHNQHLAALLFTQEDDFDATTLTQSSSSAQNGPDDRKLFKFISECLVGSFPSALKTTDNAGMIPFEKIITDWIEQSYQLERQKSEKTFASLNRRGSDAAAKLADVWTTTSVSVSTAINWAGRSLHIPNCDQNHDYVLPATLVDLPEPTEDPQSQSGKQNSFRSHLRSALSFNRAGERPAIFPSGLQLTASSRYAIKTLSFILDELEERSTKRSFRKKVRRRLQTIDQIVSDVVKKIASIPNFISTIFLLEDDSDRGWALSTSLIKRVTVCPISIGPWMITALQATDTDISLQGLEFLKYSSNVIEHGFVAQKRSASEMIEELSRQKQIEEKFQDALCELDGFIPSLLALEERHIEEAATTLIVRNVLDRMVVRPFAVSCVFFDFFFLGLLLVGFRYATNDFLLGSPEEDVLFWIYVANTGIFYFIIREIGKAVTILERTRKARVYLWSFWNITDFSSTLLALTSTVVIRTTFSHDIDYNNIESLRALLAVTTGLLWLRVLSLLKVLNMQLATFVLAILQITKDILWFLLILFTLVASWAQMFYTMFLPPSCAELSREEVVKEEQCSQAEFYVKVYSILLGDFGQFDRDQFTTAFSLFLIVFFTFMVVIVLLNVLIAIVSDSYEKCLVRSQCLFGRARVMLVAELVSFQDLLRSTKTSETPFYQQPYSDWWKGKVWNNCGWTRGSVCFFCASSLVVFVWTIGEVAGYFSGEMHGSVAYSLLSIIVNVVLYAGIMVFLSRGSNTDSDETSDNQTNDNSLLGRIHHFVQPLMQRLLGSSQDRPNLFGGKETDEWRGRLHHLQTEMSRIVDSSNVYVAEQIKLTEQRLSASESRIQSQVIILEDAIAELSRQVSDCETRNQEFILQLFSKMEDNNNRASSSRPLRHRYLQPSSVS